MSTYTYLITHTVHLVYSHFQTVVPHRNLGHFWIGTVLGTWSSPLITNDVKAMKVRKAMCIFVSCIKNIFHKTMLLAAKLEKCFITSSHQTALKRTAICWKSHDFIICVARFGRTPRLSFRSSSSLKPGWDWLIATGFTVSAHSNTSVQTPHPTVSVNLYF